MVTVIVIALILTQLLSFYLIILLNSKIAKFKDLEIRQDKLLNEMDDSISLYLVEMKQENDRLIEQLNKVGKRPSEIQKFDYKMPLKEPSITKVEEDKISNRQQLEQENSKAVVLEDVRSFIPKNMAARAYGQQVVSTQSSAVEPILAEAELSHEQQIIAMHRAGQTVEKIAKKMQKGKTEIELLLKFHN